LIDDLLPRWQDALMVARKISISMDETLIDEVQQAAEEAGMTVSAWIAEQARDRVRLLGLAKLVDDWQKEHGSFTREEIDAMHAEFDAAGVADNRPGRRT
jgi:hypothetical protein